MNARVVKELKLRQAQLDERAERLRSEWRAAPALGPKAKSLAVEVKSLQAMADEYAGLIRVAEGTA